MTNEHVRALLQAYISAECRWIGETSTNILDGYRGVVDDAKQRAGLIGVAWDDALVPEYVRDCIVWAEGETAPKFTLKPVSKVRAGDVCELDLDDVAEIEEIFQRKDGSFIAWVKGDKLPIYFRETEQVPVRVTP